MKGVGIVIGSIAGALVTAGTYLGLAKSQMPALEKQAQYDYVNGLSSEKPMTFEEKLDFFE